MLFLITTKYRPNVVPKYYYLKIVPYFYVHVCFLTNLLYLQIIPFMQLVIV